MATLPQIKGSDKQVAWAEEIRGKVAEGLVAFLEAVRKADYSKAPADKVSDMRIMAEAVEWVAGQDSARYWIDNRFETSAKQLVFDRVKEVKGIKPAPLTGTSSMMV